jgi:hypothetical protein
MYEQPEPQYSYYQESSQAHSYYLPPSSDSHSPVQSYYEAHSHSYPAIRSDHSNDSNGSRSATYGYASQYPSPPAAFSPSSSSTDPELKRIRNTAASARFRAKKKRREASLERNAKEKREVLERLEQRIRELEAENRFLKGLIFDKEKLDGVKSELERVREIKKGLEMEAGEGKRNDGVGTTT